MSVLHKSVFVGLLASAVVCGGSALAGSLAIKSAGIYQPGNVAIAGPGFNGSAYSSAVEFSILPAGAKAPQTIYAFCVDLFHEISVGFDFNHNIVAGAGDAQSATNLPYHTAPLTVNSYGGLSGQSGAPLSSLQVGEIGALADLGRGYITNNSADLSNKLDAVQAAIWEVEYPTYAITPQGAAVQNYVTQDLSYAASHPQRGVVQAIYADNGQSQGFVVGVPEPTSWSLMIIGVGMIGGLARRRAKAAA